MFFKKINLFFTLTLIGALPSFAQPLVDKQYWDKLAYTNQLTYAIGVADSWLNTVAEPEVMRYKREVRECFVELNINAGNFVEIIESEYTDLSLWHRPPSAVFLSGTLKLCKPHIDEKRLLKGEPPLEYD